MEGRQSQNAAKDWDKARRRERKEIKAMTRRKAKLGKREREQGSCRVKSIACGVPGHAAVGCVVKVAEKLQGLRVVWRIIGGLVAAWFPFRGHPPHCCTCEHSTLRRWPTGNTHRISHKHAYTQNSIKTQAQPLRLICNLKHTDFMTTKRKQRCSL